MKTNNKTMAKFVERYCRDLDRSMDFGIWDHMYNKRLLSNSEISELKQSYSNQSSVSNDLSIEALFVKLKQIFAKQFITDVANTEKYRKEQAMMKEKLRKRREAAALRMKIERDVVKRLSPKERKLLGLKLR